MSKATLPHNTTSIILVLFLANFLFAQVQPRVPANFSLQVNGQVRFAGSHLPAERVLVRIESFSGGLISQATTDRSGKFSFNGLTAMQYIVTVHAPGYMDVRENVDLLTSNSGYLQVELVPESGSAGRNNNEASPGLRVINANIPVEAQTEYAKGQASLHSGSSAGAADAVKSLEKAVSLYPDYLEAQVLLGLAYMDLQKWDKAEKPLRKAIAIDPRASTAYFALAETYLRQKKYSEGEKVLADAFKLSPNSAQGHFTLAKIYWEKAPLETEESQFRKDAESAWKEVSKALELDPALAEAHLLAGNMLLRARRGNDALAQFEQYLKLDPQGAFAVETAAIVKKLKESLSKTEKKD